MRGILAPAAAAAMALSFALPATAATYSNPYPGMYSSPGPYAASPYAPMPPAQATAALPSPDCGSAIDWNRYYDSDKSGGLSAACQRPYAAAPGRFAANPYGPAPAAEATGAIPSAPLFSHGSAIDWNAYY